MDYRHKLFIKYMPAHQSNQPEANPIPLFIYKGQPLRYFIIDQSISSGGVSVPFLPGADWLVRLSLLLSLASTGQTLYSSVKKSEVVVTETQGRQRTIRINNNLMQNAADILLPAGLMKTNSAWMPVSHNTWLSHFSWTTQSPIQSPSMEILWTKHLQQSY